MSTPAIGNARSTSTAAGAPARARLPPPPGLEDFPAIGGRPADDGDDLLDALLDLSVAEKELQSYSAQGLEGGAIGSSFLDMFGPDDSGQRPRPDQVAAASAAIAASRGGSVQSRVSVSVGQASSAWDRGGNNDDTAAADVFFGQKDGDSELDALLGLGVGPDPRAEMPAAPPALSAVIEKHEGGVRIGKGTTNDDDDAVVAEEAASNHSRRSQDVVGPGLDSGIARALGAEGGGGAVLTPPFEGTELGQLCKHLNDRNRKAKRLAQRCQEMFLRLFFKVTTAIF